MWADLLLTFWADGMKFIPSILCLPSSFCFPSPGHGDLSSEICFLKSDRTLYCSPCGQADFYFPPPLLEGLPLPLVLVLLPPPLPQCYCCCNSLDSIYPPPWSNAPTFGCISEVFWCALQRNFDQLWISY